MSCKLESNEEYNAIQCGENSPEIESEIAKRRQIIIDKIKNKKPDGCRGHEQEC